jgi:hypothetical protein
MPIRRRSGKEAGRGRDPRIDPDLETRKKTVPPGTGMQFSHSIIIAKRLSAEGPVFFTKGFSINLVKRFSFRSESPSPVDPKRSGKKRHGSQAR